jgi:TctA family transporter
MGLILGNLLEVSLIQAKMMGGGGYGVFLERPGAAIVLCFCAVAAATTITIQLLGRRRQTPVQL